MYTKSRVVPDPFYTKRKEQITVTRPELFVYAVYFAYIKEKRGVGWSACVFSLNEYRQSQKMVFAAVMQKNFMTVISSQEQLITL